MDLLKVKSLRKAETKLSVDMKSSLRAEIWYLSTVIKVRVYSNKKTEKIIKRWLLSRRSTISIMLFNQSYHLSLISKFQTNNHKMHLRKTCQSKHKLIYQFKITMFKFWMTNRIVVVAIHPKRVRVAVEVKVAVKVKVNLSSMMKSRINFRMQARTQTRMQAIMQVRM